MPQRAAQDAARVDQQTVGAAQVQQQVLAIVAHDQRVVAADEHRVDRDVGLLAPPDQDAVADRRTSRSGRPCIVMTSLARGAGTPAALATSLRRTGRQARWYCQPSSSIA